MGDGIEILNRVAKEDLIKEGTLSKNGRMQGSCPCGSLGEQQLCAQCVQGTAKGLSWRIAGDAIRGLVGLGIDQVGPVHQGGVGF